MNSGKMTLHTTTPDQTRAIGEALGRLLRPGDVVLLHGDLGAGKTTFTQGLARGAGTDELVNSPTFILVNEYRGRLPIYHADLYRLDDPHEVAALDLAGISLDGALVVEWPERGDGLLPDDHLLVRIEHVSPEERTLRFEPHGQRAQRVVEQLCETAPPPSPRYPPETDSEGT
jgi:tRNA threonylcarbamoyladenosine biosynthesis protein TsaE